MSTLLLRQIIKLGVFFKLQVLNFLVYFAFAHSSLIAQTTLKKGIVVDENTKQVISFANFIVKGTSFGTCGNEFGYFELMCKNSDTVIVSCVGYQQMQMLGYQLKDTIGLNASVEILKEITVTSKKNRTTVSWLGNVSNKRDGVFTAVKEVALFIENPYNEDVIIRKVKFSFSKIRFDDSEKGKRISNKDVLVRLNIYNDLAVTNYNLSNLIKKNIIKTLSESDKVMVFNIEDEQIYLPKQGAYISAEFMGYNEGRKFVPYSEENKTVLFQFAPVFSSKHQKANSWYKVGYEQKWKHFKYGGKPFSNFNFSIEVEK